MLVTAQGFGSIWERRSAKDASSCARRFAQTAFYNTTGVFVNGKVRPRWRIGGKIRFNAIGGFTPGCPRRSLNRVFECKEPELSGGGWTQILFKRMLNGPQQPDFYLFVVTAEYTGRIDVESANWKAESVQVVALSEDGDQQQGMLLMPAYSRVRGALGTFYAEPSTKRFWSADLLLARG